MDRAALERLVASSPLATATAWYAVDASVWPRCDAETSPERGYYPHPYRHSHGQPIVAGWNSSWLVQVPSRCSSWTAPLRLRRLRPGENANQVAAEQLRSWLCQASAVPPDTPPPICSVDAGDDSIQLSLAVADTPMCLCAWWSACAPAAASLRTRPVSPSPASRVGIGPNSSLTSPPPG